MQRLRHLALTCAVCLPIMAGSVAAQDREQTLADIRQELTVLFVEIQRLKRELTTTGAPSASLSGSSVLERVGAIEAELQRLTAQTEELDFRVQRIVEDGTNRIGDLEFRLVELEGGDLSQLGETTTLGGESSVEEDTASVAPDVPREPSLGEVLGVGELAVAEEEDFKAALTDLEGQNYQAAADKLSAFKETYPGSPLLAQADFSRGKALDGLGDTREAARAYLASFTGNATGPLAPKALFELGAALGRLGQVDQACITLAEVGVRFPGNAAVAEAEAERASLSCL